MILDQEHDNLYADIRAQLAEHFPSFLFIVMDDDGDMYYDYTNTPVGKMLAKEMLEDLNASDPLDIDWDYEYEEDDSNQDEDESED
jgi:hypothetical protein